MKLKELVATLREILEEYPDADVTISISGIAELLKERPEQDYAISEPTYSVMEHYADDHIEIMLRDWLY